MKQFQKYGVAAAVASVAASGMVQANLTESGDAAIVPYYTVNNGFNTGVHIINTSDSTQVVKVRLRRGADSKDALDFNVIMSPRDEWTGSVQAGGDTGVQMVTGDTSCTAPAFTDGVAQMPSTFAAGATEGYIEIIGMAQTINETQPIAVAAKHAEGVPADCDEVRNNFFRVNVASATDGSSNPERVVNNGVHQSNLTSSGKCADITATNTACGNVVTAVLANASTYEDTDDRALKVSFMITDSDGGLEFGDNAVMIDGFSANPMMTNQQALSFGTDGKLNYDALNFELPNLAQGALDAVRSNAALTNGSMFNDLRDKLDADSLINDWASFETADATVATDWVVTLPGQYTMVDPICSMYDSYAEAQTACSSTALSTAAAVAGRDRNELPLTLASNASGDVGGQNSNLTLWDREEGQLNGEDPTSAVAPPTLGFSPGGSASDPAATPVVATLAREVNVLSFNGASVLGTADEQSEDLGLGVAITVEGGDRGWAQLDIVPTAGAEIFLLGSGTSIADTDDILPADRDGDFQAVSDTGATAVVGMAVWERSFAGQAGNYGRAVEHSTIVSSGSNGRQ